jgi:hypothetical protein
MCPNFVGNACTCNPVKHHTHVYFFGQQPGDDMDAFIERSTLHALGQEAEYRKPPPKPRVELPAAALRALAVRP